MPYEIKHEGDEFVVVTKETGKVHAREKSKAKAEAVLRALYANADPAEEGHGKALSFEFILGDDAKALGDGKFEGRLITFGDESTPDRSPMRDWFPRSCDFGFEPGETITTPIFYHHGLDAKCGARRYGRGTLSIRDDGVWCAGSIPLTDDDARTKYAAIERGEMKMSSGVPRHLIRRTPVGETHRLDRWILGSDASITRTPADTRTFVRSIKALLGDPDPDVKGEYLGEVAGPMTAHAALATLHNHTLNRVTDHMADRSRPRDEREAAAHGCLSEYHAKARKVVSALMDDDDADDAAKALLDEITDPTRLPGLVDRAEALVADAEALRGLFARAVDQRAADGRHLSRPKRDAIKAMADELAALHRASEPIDRARLALRLRLQ